jgi:hypothetical protein
MYPKTRQISTWSHDNKYCQRQGGGIQLTSSQVTGGYETLPISSPSSVVIKKPGSDFVPGRSRASSSSDTALSDNQRGQHTSSRCWRCGNPSCGFAHGSRGCRAQLRLATSYILIQAQMTHLFPSYTSYLSSLAPQPQTPFQPFFCRIRPHVRL